MEVNHDQENQFPPEKKDNQKPPAVFGSSPKQLGSGEGQLWIKLKIQNIEEQEDQIRPRRNDQPRVCEVCKKGFSSGKALGGHMRVHVQANKQELKTNNRDCDNARLTCYHRPTCSICSKNFPSMKSLFGHMRCHPEREWRGIQPPRPPPPASKDSSSSSSLVSKTEQLKTDNRTESDSDMGIREIDLTKSLVGWSATAKRGRSALTAAATTTVAEDKLLRDAVDDLMRLAHGGDSLESGSGLTHKHRVVEATNSNSLTNKAEIKGKNRVFESKKRRRIDEWPVGFRMDDHHHHVKKLKIDERESTDDIRTRIDISDLSISGVLDKGNGKTLLETEPREENNNNFNDDDDDDDEDELDSKNSNGSVPGEQLIMNYKHKKTNRPVMMIKKNNKKRMKLKLSDLGSTRDDRIHRPINRYYKCSTCSKIFTTHQALGGHRSSHNKAKNSHHSHSHSPTIDESSSEAAEEISQADEMKEKEGAGSSKLADGAPHRCKICNKNFATGQALGGHKRRHWTGPVEAPASQATSSPGEASQTGRKILGFDLNELPAVEDEGGVEESEEHVGGYGYASSSFNNSVS